MQCNIFCIRYSKIQKKFEKNLGVLFIWFFCVPWKLTWGYPELRKMCKIWYSILCFNCSEIVKKFVLKYGDDSSHLLYLCFMSIVSAFESMGKLFCGCTTGIILNYRKLQRNFTWEKTRRMLCCKWLILHTLWMAMWSLIKGYYVQYITAE